MSGQDPKFVKGAFAKIADRYVVTNHVLSMGTDILWLHGQMSLFSWLTLRS